MIIYFILLCNIYIIINYVFYLAVVKLFVENPSGIVKSAFRVGGLKKVSTFLEELLKQLCAII